MLIISHNSMFIAQSGPINISLVALSAQAAALPAMSDVLIPLHSSPLSSKFPKIISQKKVQLCTVLTFVNVQELIKCKKKKIIRHQSLISWISVILFNSNKYINYFH